MLSQYIYISAVCIAMPQDVEGEAYDYPEYFFQKRVWDIERRPATDIAIEKAAAAIRAAKKPMLVCGGGVRYSEAHEEFKAFAEALLCLRFRQYVHSLHNIRYALDVLLYHPHLLV